MITVESERKALIDDIEQIVCQKLLGYFCWSPGNSCLCANTFVPYTVNRYRIITKSSKWLPNFVVLPRTFFTLIELVKYVLTAPSLSAIGRRSISLRESAWLWCEYRTIINTWVCRFYHRSVYGANVYKTAQTSFTRVISKE